MHEKERNIIIATNIKKLITDNKITQKKLAQQIGISPSTMSDYMNLRSNPSHGVIQKIADFFGVMKSDIDTTYKETGSPISTIYNQLIPERQSKVYNFAQHQLNEQTRLQTNNKVVVMMPTRSTTVEIAGKLSAGGGTYNDKNCVETVEVGNTPSHYDLAFQVAGDSMYPTFEDGEIVFVKETNDVFNGQIGAVEINGEAFIKKMYLEDHKVRLVSLNTDVDENGDRLYPDFYSDDFDDLYIIGRVII